MVAGEGGGSERWRLYFQHRTLYPHSYTISTPLQGKLAPCCIGRES